MILRISNLDKDTPEIIKFLAHEKVDYAVESGTGVFTSLVHEELSLVGLKNIVNGLMFLTNPRVEQNDPDTIKELFEHHLTLAKITMLKYLCEKYAKDLFTNNTLDLAMESARAIIPGEEFFLYDAYAEEIATFKRKSKFFKFEI